MDAVFDSPIQKGDAGTRLEQYPTAQNGEPGIADTLHTRWKLSKQFRALYDAPWDRYRRIYSGDQWANKLRPPWKARPVMNYTFVSIETIVPLMTENRPAIVVLGEEPKWDKAADMMTDIIHAIFGNNEMDVKEVYLLKDAHIYGTSVAKIYYDPVIDDIVISSIDTRFFYPSPGATDIQSAEYVIVAVNRWIPSIKRDFPDFKGEIPYGVWDETLTHKPIQTQKTIDADGTFNFSETSVLVSQVTQPAVDSTQMATQIEMWDRDKDGNVWVTIMANGVLLKRMPSPFKHKRFPFARLLCYPINSQFWGMGEVAQLESPQDTINRAEAQIADLARLCTSPYMLIDRQARVSLKDITNRIGAFIVKEEGKVVTWMPPPSVSPALFNIVTNAKNHMDNLASTHEALRGQLPSKEISGVAINELKQSSSGRIGLKTRMFEAFLREVAIQSSSLAQQFYSDRQVRVGGDRKYIWVNKFLPDGTVENDISSAKFKIEIGVGSTLPIDKGIRFNQSLQLRQIGAMSLKTLLRDSGRSEHAIQQVMKELDEEKSQAIQEQAAAQQAAAGSQQAPTEASAPSVPAAAGQGIPSEEEIAQLEQALGGGGGGAVPQ